MAAPCFLIATLLSALSVSFFYLLQSHDHSLCIRPDLPKYTVTAQQANFTLLGQLVLLPSSSSTISKIPFTFLFVTNYYINVSLRVEFSTLNVRVETRTWKYEYFNVTSCSSRLGGHQEIARVGNSAPFRRRRSVELLSATSGHWGLVLNKTNCAETLPFLGEGLFCIGEGLHVHAESGRRWALDAEHCVHRQQRQLPAITAAIPFPNLLHRWLWR